MADEMGECRHDVKEATPGPTLEIKGTTYDNVFSFVRADLDDVGSEDYVLIPKGEGKGLLDGVLIVGDDGRPKYPPLPPSTSYTLSRAPLAFPPPSSAIESLEILRSHLSARLLEARRRSSSLKLLTKSKLSSLLESRLKLSKKQHSTPNPVRINKVHWRYKADLRILDVLIYFTLKDPCLDVAFVLSSKDVRVASKSGVWWKTPLSPRDDEGGTKCCVVEGTLGEIAYKEEGIRIHVDCFFRCQRVGESVGVQSIVAGWFDVPLEDLVTSGSGGEIVVNKVEEGGEEPRDEEICDPRPVATLSWEGLPKGNIGFLRKLDLPHGTSVSIKDDGRVEVRARSVEERDGVVGWLKGIVDLGDAKDTMEGRRRERGVWEALEEEKSKVGVKGVERKEILRRTDWAVFMKEMT